MWAIGPAIIMKFCALTTQPLGVPTIVNLNSIIVEGIGTCVACRVEVGRETRFACMDGPEFDGHQVDGGLLLASPIIFGRSTSYSLFGYFLRLGSRRNGEDGPQTLPRHS